jgi:anaerobic glycerol-3-phosphate dehydrogenase
LSEIFRRNGRGQVTIGADGLPATVTVTRPASAHGVITARQIELLAEPVTLQLQRAGGIAIPPTVLTPAKVWRKTSASVDWYSVFVAGPAQITVNGTIHFDGYMDFAATFAPASASDAHFEVDDILLCIKWLPQSKDQLYHLRVICIQTEILT